MAQRIVVPRGIVNPGETSVIDIPQHYQASNLVVAAPKPMSRPIHQSSPVYGAGGGHGDLDISRISRGRQNFSDECPCPKSPHGSYYRGFLSDPQQRWGPPSPMHSSGPLTAKRRLQYSSSPEQEESARSFAYGEEESVYDDTVIRQRRQQAQRERVVDPWNYEEFHHGAAVSRKTERHHTPEGHAGPSSQWVKPKLQKKSLRHAMDDEEIQEMKSMMQNVHFAHNLKVYQKARRNLLRQAAKITHQAFKKIEKVTSVCSQPKSESAKLVGFKKLEQ